MKRALWIGLAMLLLFGCDTPLSEAGMTPVPTVTPAPTPAPVVVLVGGSGAPQFTEAVRRIVHSAACEFAEAETFAPDMQEIDGRAAFIIYWTGETPPLLLTAAEDAAVYLYAAAGQSLPATQLGLRYDDTAAADMALGAALAYENHDTPVRLLGLFESADSAAKTAWDAAVEEGRVFDKGTSVGGEAEAWLAGALETYFEGMLDGIFCESAALAESAETVLIKQARRDIEIFSAAADAELLLSMQTGEGAVVRAVGARPKEAGRLCAEQALILLYGGEAQSLTIQPEVFAIG